MAETEKQRDIISVAVVPFKQKLFVQPKLKNNNVRLIRYTVTAVQDYEMHYMNALCECLAKEMCL